MAINESVVKGKISETESLEIQHFEQLLADFVQALVKEQDTDASS